MDDPKNNVGICGNAFMAVILEIENGYHKTHAFQYLDLEYIYKNREMCY